MNLLRWLFESQLHFGTKSIPLREVMGGTLGLISAILASRRLIAAWPVGILGDALLFTVFLGAIFTFGDPTQERNFYGQAGRNLLLILVSIYGWSRWAAYRRTGVSKAPVQPRWSTTHERLIIIPLFLLFFAISFLLFRWLGESGQWLLVDTWIFAGTALATWGMSKGLVEFWLVWIAVDIVGVPFALSNGYYPTGILYGLYMPFVIWGFWNWQQISKRERLLSQ